VAIQGPRHASGGGAIRGTINPQSYVTLIPIPPSKLPTDPEYDTRVADIARMVSPNADVREIIVAVAARQPLHESEQRLTPDQLIAMLQIQEALCNPVPHNIILIDDVITTGCSFVACSTLLQARFPGVPISGIFAARRAVDRSAVFESFANLGDL
jgi:predicted amidophosphoribosyltransferase